jgi:hypothetical protein
VDREEEEYGRKGSWKCHMKTNFKWYWKYIVCVRICEYLIHRRYVLLQELMLKGKKWQQLTWAHYSVTQLYRSTGKVTETNFDIDNSMTSLYFSPVKSYFISDVCGDPL